MAKRFCTIEDVKTYANVAHGYASQDEAIRRCIEQVTTKIITFTRRSWLFGMHTEHFNLARTNWNSDHEKRFQKIFPSERPLHIEPYPEITYTLNGSFSDASKLRRTDYAVNQFQNSITLLLAYSYQQPRALRLTYYAGYMTDPNDSDHVLVSEDLREACAMQAAFLYSRAQDETIGIKKFQDKSGIKEFSILGSGFIREVQGLLTPHVRSLTGG